MPKEGADISLSGVSRADEGAVAEAWYLGVRASEVWGMFMYSKSSVGSV